MTEVSDTLRAARKLIEKPENWCQSRFMVDGHGADMNPWKSPMLGWPPVPFPAGFGLQGALCGAIHQRKAFDVDMFGRCLRALDAQAPEGNATNFNDHPDTTHPMVLDLFDRAIEMEEADG